MTKASKSTVMLYKPVGLLGSVAAGMIAGKIFDQVWKKVSPEKESDPPGPLQREYPLKEIVVAAALQGAIFAVVRTLVARGGATAFQRATGRWPE